MIVVAGENVVDLVPAGDGLLRPALGGGPANTAIAAAKLGATVAFAARFGADSFGHGFRQRLADAGVDLRYAIDLANPSALALATVDAHGVATYEFWLDGAADFASVPFPATGPEDIRHAGSLAAYWHPGADDVETWLADRPRLATLDVNLRPIVLERQGDWRERLARLVAAVDVVKASDDDLRLAYPDLSPEDAARAWLAADPARPTLAVVTLGAAGILGLSRDGQCVHVPAMPVTVVDTIGAGDAAMGALLARLSERGLDGVLADLDGTLRHAAAAAALACTHPGAYAPSTAEVAALLDEM